MKYLLFCMKVINISGSAVFCVGGGKYDEYGNRREAHIAL